MNVYKVSFTNNNATSAVIAGHLHHGDIGFDESRSNVEWFAIECDNVATAIEIAELTIKKLWGE